MKNMMKLGAVISKILEVFHWVGAALLAAASVCAVIAPQWVGLFVGIDAKACCGATLDVYGFEVQAAAVNGSIDMTVFALFGIGGTLILALMAMVFRNLHQTFRATQDGSPFQKDNIRRMKEIGIFSIAVPVIGLFMALVLRLVAGTEAAEVSMDMGGVFTGILVLCLTQYFICGANLEKDVDGLL